MRRYRLPKMLLTADIVIFTIRSARLEILLIERGGDPYRGTWALPGGFVEEDEHIDTAACRELEEETGVKGQVLEQFHAFGDPKRDPRGRVVTVAYYTLVPPGRLSPKAADDAARAEWFDADKLPRLAFDHAEIIDFARRRLGCDLERTTRAAGVLPKAFTLAELRGVCELVRGEPIEPRGFRRRILALGLVQSTATVRKRGRREERLYRFKRSSKA
jgi:8-oxo-dGTP diphosphatase